MHPNLTNHRRFKHSDSQTFKYGKLGEVIENIRTFALPFENQTYTFKMQYQYDSYNRIQRMTYPDGERVRYGYNLGGMLCRVAGQKDGRSYRYIDSIHYNRFELKEGVWYGNGTRVSYTYDSLQRLSRLQSACADGAMQDIAYTYDSVGNILRIENGAGTLSNGLGGTYSSNYEYDDLYRLTGSTGTWAGASALNYQTTAQYHANGRISRKNLAARTLLHGIADTVNYARGYSYAEAQPNTLVQVSSGRWDEGALMVTAPEELQFVWDAAGNLTRQQLVGDNQRFLCWDEQNRLQGVKDNRYLSYYQYDANGDRTYKLTGKGELQNISGNWQYYYLLDNATLYASPYLVATDRGYTKHYYAESERIASRIGGGGLGDALGSRLVDEESFSAHQAASAEHFDAVTYCLGADAQPVDDLLLFLYDWRDSVQPEDESYWYHPDHLGSSSWITDKAGKAVQHLHYLPWGEDYVNQRTGSFSSMYTFSAKEKDAETGYSYFGSRYYNSDLSIWLSVDPMADKYPSLSPYTYCADNPVKLVDPNGEEIDDDIVFHGKNNSSITIKTSLIDLEVNANVDFGGNFTLNLENVAIGFQTEFVATGQAGIGTSYSGFKSKIMFLGGDYAGYWYDYIGGEMQVLAGVSVEASVGIQTSVVLGFYSGDKKGNTPESFAGAYTGVSCSAGLKAALFGVNLSASNVKSMDNRWTIYTFGVSITQGYQEGLGPTVGSGFGHARLTTTSVPTKQRTIGDRIKNLLSH